MSAEAPPRRPRRWRRDRRRRRSKSGRRRVRAVSAARSRGRVRPRRAACAARATAVRPSVGIVGRRVVRRPQLERHRLAHGARERLGRRAGGPVIVGPSAANLMTGGSLPLAACLKKSIQYAGFSQNDTDRRLAVGDERPRQLLGAEVLRHRDGEHAPLAAGAGNASAGRSPGPPGSMRLFGPDRNVERLVPVAIEVAEQERRSAAVLVVAPSLRTRVRWPRRLAPSGASWSGACGGGCCRPPRSATHSDHSRRP